ncbi:P-loop containing nucleoside triphosphate hydrolase protein [Terfezia claveryi]|nr:P-loop containing nucleoside triphosphate hydrolase protein [Terfezia claveryi]
MAKRTIDEVEVEPLSNGVAEIVAKKKKKEKKEKREKKEKVGLTGDAQVELEEEEEAKRERGEKYKKAKEEKKRERKEKKGKKTKKEKKDEKEKREKTGKKAAEGEEAVEESKPADENEEPKKLSKEERKASKVAKKAVKKSVENNTTSTNGSSDKASGSSTAATSSGTYTEHPELSAVPQLTIDEYLKKNFISSTDPLKAPQLRPFTKFPYLPIEDETQQKSFLNFTSGFAAPTPIQAAVWPYLLAGRDCIGVAETGSGKTLAFGVPAIRRILALPAKERKGVKVLVVSPTRELAMQSHEHLDKMARDDGLTAVCVYGGVPKDEQRRLLKKATIVVATPGRLNDLIQEGAADLNKVDYMVLDEADRMLDKGFEEDIKKIIGATSPVGRQTLMFTATWPQSVRDLAATFMKTPVHFTIGDNPTGDLRANVRIAQQVEVVDHFSKERRLNELIRGHQSANSEADRILVFCLYKKEAVRVENFLQQKGYRVASIHGDLNQGQRTQALQSFKDGKCPILIATDVAARGLDIPKVKLVINVTFPLTIEDYVHRIGRTGRAGETGKAVTLFTEHDKTHSGALVNILKAAGQPVPEALLKFGTTVKKKEHSVYGAFFKDTENAGTAKKIKYSD